MPLQSPLSTQAKKDQSLQSAPDNQPIEMIDDRVGFEPIPDDVIPSEVPEYSLHSLSSSTDL